jgi:hypothetical protein
MKLFDADRGGILRETFDRLVADWPGVTRETIFGCPSYRVDGTLFAVLVTDAVALTRLSGEDREELERGFTVAPFRADGRTVSAWTQVLVDDPGRLDALLPYVTASYEAARSSATA